MTDRTQLHILRRSDIEANSWYANWERGVELAQPSPAKRAMMLANPFTLQTSAPAEEPMQIIGTKGYRIIGRIDLIAGRLLVADQVVPIAWGSQFFVPLEDRATMMGAMLLMKVQQLGFAAGAHGPSQMAVPLYSKLKWNEIPLQRWIILRKSRSIIQRYLGLTPLAPVSSVARVATDLGLVAHRGYVGLRRAAQTSGLRAIRVQAMPSELADTLESTQARSGELARGARTIEWINWLLANHFGGDSHAETELRHERALYLITRARSFEPIGYFLLKVKFFPIATHRRFPDLTLASLCDVGIFEPASCTVEAATHLAFQAAGELNADALEVCDVPGVRKAFYQTLGFLPGGTMRLMVRGVPNTTLADPTWKDPAKWDIRLGDGENVPN